MAPHRTQNDSPLKILKGDKSKGLGFPRASLLRPLGALCRTPDRLMISWLMVSLADSCIPHACRWILTTMLQQIPAFETPRIFSLGLELGMVPPKPSTGKHAVPPSPRVLKKPFEEPMTASWLPLGHPVMKIRGFSFVYDACPSSL